MGDVVTYEDPERVCVEILKATLSEMPETVGVGISVPKDWKPTGGQTPHLQVVCDGTPRMEHPVFAHATIRIVARANKTTEAKRLAILALGILSAWPGGDGVARIRPLTGVLPARDTETSAEMASVTAQVTLRSTVVVV